MQDFQWLEGKWKRHNVSPGTTAFEIWEQTNDGFSGEGITMKGADTMFVEKLSMIKKDGQFFYVADVSSNTAPTYFKVTSVSEKGFISENPAHDFPKKIEYLLEGDRLTAIISAGDKKMGFVFERMK
ncbi:MAG: hypothetical protein Tsb0034_25140 [Ekhidna sp.]